MSASLVCSVVIVTWNSERYIGPCLAALAASTQRSFECIVVDNASTDGTVAHVRSAYPWVRLIEAGSNIGFVAANNLALRQATGNFVLLLNPDAELAPGALDVLIDFLYQTPKAGTVAPKLLNSDGTLQYSTFVMPSVGTIAWEYFLRDLVHPNHQRAGRYVAADYDVERQVDGVLGACFLVRKAAIEDIGMFDPRFFMYCEEVDWQERLRRAGWQVWYTPQAEAVHHGGQSAKLAPVASFLELQRSRFKLYSKWYARRQRVALETVTRAGMLYQMVFWTKQALRGRLTRAEWHGRIALSCVVLAMRPSGERW